MKFNSTRGKYKSIYIRNSENEDKIDNLNRTTIKFNQNYFQKKITKIPIFSGLLEIVEGGVGA